LRNARLKNFMRYTFLIKRVINALPHPQTSEVASFFTRFYALITRFIESVVFDLIDLFGVLFFFMILIQACQSVVGYRLLDFRSQKIEFEPRKK
jgi:hypothetical protein